MARMRRRLRPKRIRSRKVRLKKAKSESLLSIFTKLFG